MVTVVSGAIAEAVKKLLFDTNSGDYGYGEDLAAGASKEILNISGEKGEIKFLHVGIRGSDVCGLQVVIDGKTLINTQLADSNVPRGDHPQSENSNIYIYSNATDTMRVQIKNIRFNSSLYVKAFNNHTAAVELWFAYCVLIFV